MNSGVFDTREFERRARRLGRDAVYDSAAFNRLNEDLQEALLRYVETVLVDLAEKHKVSMTEVADVFFGLLHDEEMCALERELRELKRRDPVEVVADATRGWRVSVSYRTTVKMVCLMYLETR